MKYSLLIIDSGNVYDYWENAANGVRYDDLTGEEFNKLLEMSLKQGFSVVVQSYEKEE